MNTDPNYSPRMLCCNRQPSALESHGLTFTIGRGNELVSPQLMRSSAVGQHTIIARHGSFWKQHYSRTASFVVDEKALFICHTAVVMNELTLCKTSAPNKS